jgi:uncharacterized membrane protein YdjX (TVP38/TMEM64 family)
MADRLVPIARWTLVVVTGVAVVVVVAGLVVTWERGLSVQTIEDTILAWGSWGVLASIGLMVLHSFVPFPAEFVAFANGMVYGPVWGTVITWTGAMLGAFAAFGLARAFGRPFVAHMVARKNWRVLDEWTARQGGTMVLVGRFIPVISFNLINYAAGLTRISWWTFAWTTGVGILPLTTVMVVMGHRIESLSLEAWLALGIGALGLSWLVRRQLRRSPTSETLP